VKDSIKIAVLSSVLACDLAFFLIIKQEFPQIYEWIFIQLPFPNDFEKTIAIFIGFIIAVLTALLIVRIPLTQLKKSMQGEKDE
jgi:hypothetical protein